MTAEGTKRTVVVSGDFTLDWNLARGRGPEARDHVWEAATCSRLRWQRGGAGLLADLIDGVAKRIHCKPAIEVRQQGTPRRPAAPEDPVIGPEDKRYHHSFASWKPHEFAAKGSKAAEGHEKADPAWRVSEFEGINQCETTEPPGDWAKVENDDPDAELVILDDANLGFRDQRDRHLWPASLTEPGKTPWVLVKMSRPVAKGDLWEWLCEKHAEKLVVVMTVKDLRRTTAQVTHALSWERTAQDLVWELTYNPTLASLQKCRHLIVSFNAAGAFLCSRGAEGNPVYRLIFDPEVVEGMWNQSYPGGMVGYASCLTAGIAREMLLASGEPDIRNGICAGLWALRTLHCEGYGERGKSAKEARIRFPLEKVVTALEAEQASFECPDKPEDASAPKRKWGPFREAIVPMRMSGLYWTILADKCKGDLEKRATDVVLYGERNSLRDVPLGRFGKLLTVDRQEIESLRSIGSLVSEYVAQEHPERLLSIAVFGPPGSGKSFGIKQLALSLKPGEIEVKEFNLSQIRSFEGLLSAFHQVRDIALRGKIPLVFWDEFDSDFEATTYGWLRYFLAPMQDGEFQQGDLPHPIGRAIFVFAGGTSASLDGFGKNGDETQLRAAKVPDFLSRLKGFLDVLGPNPRPGVDDPHYLLRRAVMLRSMFERSASHLLKDDKERQVEKKLQIDPGVLRALLLTDTYKHGARSMESILTMSQLEGKTRFDRSSLPTKAQLDLHVDGHNFLARVHQIDMDKLPEDLLERMAKVVHKLYCEQQEAAGWKWGKERNKETRENPSLVDFDRLPDGEKIQNRAQVQDILVKLNYAKCSMVPIREEEKPFEFPPDILEELASMEHTRWMRMKAEAGWRYGPVWDPEKKEHPSMLPWTKAVLAPYKGFEDRIGDAELSEAEKEKDRAAVRGIVPILKEAGYTIVGTQAATAPEKKIEHSTSGTYTVTWQG
jgi:hypothetical protein